MRGYRLGRVQQMLQERNLGGVLLYDPINVRYANGSSNMQVWILHNQHRYCWVPATGKTVLFDDPLTVHLAEHLETIAEIRPARTWTYFGAGDDYESKVTVWADELADVIRETAGGETRVAADHLDPSGAKALEARGFTIHNGQEVMERARSIKSDDEIRAMLISISVCEAGMAKMQEELRAGITENQLWSNLHQVNIAMGGEWIETRLLSSGGRTNPWFRECSDRIIRAGELVAFDTDMIGPFGYCSDISRTWFCKPGRPTDEQKRLYNYAYEQIQTNIDEMRAGRTFREVAETSWRVPNEFVARRYGAMTHGVGLADEWPYLTFSDKADTSMPGMLEAGMTVCVESYIGAEDGNEGVKLEEQVLVTGDGPQRLSTYPYEHELLN
ncbi:MAG: aminopeptidase P family protein [Rhodospirillales bacterium]|nr:aminopeptidase P family protein [Rhodospirillales bacterium]